MTPEIVTACAPLVMVPIRVPPSVPVPLVRLSTMAVSDVTLAAFPSGSCDWTVTLKMAPAVGLAGLIEVIASFEAVPGPAVTEKPSVKGPKVKPVHVPLPPTVTSRYPSDASAATVKSAVISVALVHATFVAVTPDPENATVYVPHESWKPDPVIVD